MLVCDMCDKGYHTFCLQPAIDTLPTNGWRCKVRQTKNGFTVAVYKLYFGCLIKKKIQLGYFFCKIKQRKCYHRM